MADTPGVNITSVTFTPSTAQKIKTATERVLNEPSDNSGAIARRPSWFEFGFWAQITSYTVVEVSGNHENQYGFQEMIRSGDEWIVKSGGRASGYALNSEEPFGTIAPEPITWGPVVWMHFEFSSSDNAVTYSFAYWGLWIGYNTCLDSDPSAVVDPVNNIRFDIDDFTLSTVGGTSTEISIHSLGVDALNGTYSSSPPSGSANVPQALLFDFQSPASAPAEGSVSYPVYFTLGSTTGNRVLSECTDSSDTIAQYAAYVAIPPCSVDDATGIGPSDPRDCEADTSTWSVTSGNPLTFDTYRTVVCSDGSIKLFIREWTTDQCGKLYQVSEEFAADTSLWGTTVPPGGPSGTFTSLDGHTITFANGIITSFE